MHVAGNVQRLGALPAQPQPFFVALGKLFNWFCNSTVCQEREWECHCFFSSFYLSADGIKISGVQTLCVCSCCAQPRHSTDIDIYHCYHHSWLARDIYQPRWEHTAAMEELKCSNLENCLLYSKMRVDDTLSPAAHLLGWPLRPG